MYLVSPPLGGWVSEVFINARYPKNLFRKYPKRKIKGPDNLLSEYVPLIFLFRDTFWVSYLGI